MKCLEAQRLMQLFLEKKLEAPQLHDFVEHIESCPDCREELELNMAVYSTLLNGKEKDRFDYNFAERTNSYLRVAKRYLRRVRMRHITQGTVIILAQLVLLLFVFSSVEGKFIRDHGKGFFSYIFAVNEETEEDSEMLSEAVSESLTEMQTEAVSETLTKIQTEAVSETLTEMQKEAVSETLTKIQTETAAQTQTETAAGDRGTGNTEPGGR